MFIIWLVLFPLCLSNIIAWNLPGFTIMLFLNQFIAISLSDSRILIKFSIVLAKLEKVIMNQNYEPKQLFTKSHWKRC